MLLMVMSSMFQTLLLRHMMQVVVVQIIEMLILTMMEFLMQQKVG